MQSVFHAGKASTVHMSGTKEVFDIVLPPTSTGSFSCHTGQTYNGQQRASNMWEGCGHAVVPRGYCSGRVPFPTDSAFVPNSLLDTPCV